MEANDICCLVCDTTNMTWPRSAVSLRFSASGSRDQRFNLSPSLRNTERGSQAQRLTLQLQCRQTCAIINPPRNQKENMDKKHMHAHTNYISCMRRFITTAEWTVSLCLNASGSRVQRFNLQPSLINTERRLQAQRLTSFLRLHESLIVKSLHYISNVYWLECR